MLTDKVDSLYNALSDKINGLGTLDEFRSRMQNPDNQRKFYDFVSNHYDIGTFEDYSAAINSSEPAAPKAEVRQDVIDTAKEAAPADITPTDNSSASYDLRLLEEERDKLRKVDAEKVAKVNSAASTGGSYSFMPAAAVNMSQKAVKQEVYDKNERLKELDRMISEAYAPIYKQAAAEAKDAAAEALKMRQEISDVQAAELSKAAKVKGVQYSPQGMTMAAQYQAALNPRLQQRESMLQVAADYYRKAAEEYEKPTRFDDTNGFANVGRGALNTVIDRDFFSRGWTEFARASATKPLFDKISQIYKDAEAQQWNEAQISAEVSRQFTPEELRALGGFMSFMDAQGRRAQNGDISLGYQIGQTVGESAGYMLDFAIGNKLFGNAISESVSSVIGRSLPNAAKGTFKHTLNTTVRWAAGASAKTVPLTAVLGSTYANIAEKTLEINPATGNPYTWGEAFCEGLTESYIENFSESSGVAMTGLIKRGLALPLKSKGVRTLVAKIGNEMTRKGLNPKSFRIADSVFGKQLAKELTDMGYNGVVEEWLEELFNAMSMEALGQITGKEAWKGQLTEDFFTKDNQAILWASFAVPGAVPGAARLAHIAKEHRRYREVKSQIADLFGDKDFAEQEANKVYNLARSSVAVQDENGKTHTKIQRVRLENDTECYIVGGKVAVDENGKVDINGSDATVYVRNVETDEAGVENISDEVTPISINSNGQRITDVLLNEDYNAVSNNLLQTDYNEYHARRKYPIGDEVIIWRQNDAGELEPTVNEDGSIAYGRVTGFENGNVIIDPLTGEDNVGIPFADAEQMLTSRTEYENIQQQQQESEENVIEMDAEQQEDKPLGVFDAGSGVQITVRSAVMLADGKRYYMVSIQSPNSEAREGLTTEKDLALSIGAKNAYNVRQEAERRQSAQAEQQAEAAAENTAEAASNAAGVIEDTNSPEQTETSEKPAETSEEPAKSEAETEYNRLTTEYVGAEMADTMIANTVANIQKSLDKKQKEYEKAQAELVELGLPFDEESKKKIEKARQKVADLKAAVDTYNGQLGRFKALQEYADKTKKQAAPADNTEGSAENSEKGNTENNIEASVESSTDTSVPDMAIDKASDARQRGYRMSEGHRYNRQGKVVGVKGKETTVIFSNDKADSVEGRYMVIEASELQPSHYPTGGRNPLFFISEAQPKDRSDKVSKGEVGKAAQNLNPDLLLSDSPVAYVSMPVINARGEAIQGNNRSNFVKEAYSINAAQTYKEALMQSADKFGLDAEAVSKMKQPVLVRMVDVSDADAIKLGQRSDLDITTGGVQRVNPINVAKLLDEKLKVYANILLASDENEDETLREIIRRNADKAIKYLTDVKAITPAQANSMYNGKGEVTKEALDDLTAILKNVIFEGGSEQLPKMFNALPATAQKALLETAFRDLHSKEGDRCIKDIQEAIMIFADMVENHVFDKVSRKDVKQVKDAVTGYRYQSSMFNGGGNFVPNEFYSNFAFELVAHFYLETYKQQKDFLNEMFDLIQGKEATLFEDAVRMSKEEAIKKLSRYDTRRATERENQGGSQNQRQNDVSALESGDKSDEQRGRGGSSDDTGSERAEGGVRPADNTGGDSPAGEQKQVKKPARKTSKKKEAGVSAENTGSPVESIFSDPSLQDDINELSGLLERFSGNKYVVPNQDEASKRNSRIEDTLQLLNVGTRITAKVFQLGITRFAKYAEVMIAKFGSSIKPFLKNIYKNSTALLQDVGLEFDSNEYVDGFNIDSLEAPKAEKVKSWSEFIDENLQGSEEITTLADEDEAFNKAQVEWTKANLETITEAYLSTHGNLLDPDEIREAFRPLGYDRTNVEKYRVAEKFLVEQIFKRMLSDANKAGNRKITFLTGVGGSGKSTATKQIKDFGKDSAIVFDSALNKYEKLKALIDQAVEAGVDDVHVLMVHNDAKTAFANTLNRGLKTNRWLSLDYFIQAFRGNAGKVKNLTDNYKDIDVMFYDNSGNNGRFVELEDALKWDHSLSEELIQQLENLIEENEQLTEQQKDRLTEDWKKRLSEVSGVGRNVRKDDSGGESGLRRPAGERDNVPLIENEAESDAEAGRTIGTVSKSKHTKTGEDLFIVVPSARVSNEDFKQLKARAKAHNGYYSSYSKNRGFIFKSEEDAKQFNNISDDELTTDKVSADTQTIETEAGAIISEAEVTGGSGRDSGAAEGEPGTESTERGLSESGNVAMSDEEADKEVSVRQQVIDKIDKHIDKVNSQLAILGYYEAEEDPRMFNESYGYQKTAEQKALKDIERLAKQIADDLGLEISKRKKLASANIAPAGGEISFSLPLVDGKELHLIVYLYPNSYGQFKEDGTRDDLAVNSMMWRIEDPAKNGMSRYLTSNQNYNAPRLDAPDEKILSVTYSQLLGDIRRIAKDHLPKKDNSDLVGMIGDVAQKERQHKESEKKGQSKKADKKRIPANEPMMLDLFSGAIEDLNTAAQQEAAQETKGDAHHGYKIGDKVIYRSKGSSKREPEVVEIVDFNYDGRPVLDSFHANWISEIANWEDIEPYNSNNNERDIRNDGRREDGATQTGTTGQPQNQNGKMGGGQQQTDEGVDGRGMDSDSESHRVHDGERGGRAAVESSLTVETNNTELPTNERRNTNNFHARKGERLSPVSPRARYEANLAAISLLKQLQEEGRQATAEEMETLAKYSGWGGLGEFFNREPGTTYYSQHGEKSPYQTIAALLTDEEMQTAQLSRNSAYYTPESVIESLWKIAARLGFKGGNILEGSAGIGNIFALMPSEISSRSILTAVEIDDITAGILAQLYPDATTHHDGFQNVNIPNNSQDLVITNVPFGRMKVYDKQEKDLSKRFGNVIHDFCIAKNVRKLRQGGLGIFITSNGTLDNSKDLRAWLNNEGNADVIGVFRMNRETFEGASVTSDIIVVRKRINGQKDPSAIDVLDTKTARIATYSNQQEVYNAKTREWETPEPTNLKLIYNSYFVEHPEAMGGEMGFGFEHNDTRWGGTTAGCYASPAIDQDKRLQDWIESLDKSDKLTTYKEPDTTQSAQDSDAERYEGTMPYGSLIADSKGRICRAQHGFAVPIEGINEKKVKGNTKAQVVNDYNAIKNAIDELLNAQKQPISDDKLKPYLQALNKAYDNFVRKYGNLNHNTSLSFLRNDVQWASIAAIEKVRETIDANGKKNVEVTKADLFAKRVVGVQTTPKAESVKDGVILSMRQFGNIRPDKIAEWLGKPTHEVEKEITDTRFGFRDPQTGNIVVRHEYLSGNVREKLAYAEEHNENGIYNANIEELRKVVPIDIPSHLIEFNLGSTWIPKELYIKYAKEKFDVDIKLNHVGSSWACNEVWGRNEKNRSEGVYSDLLSMQVYGHELMLAAMNNTPVVVSKVETDRYTKTSRTITDKVASSACSDKISQMKDDFVEWARGKMQEDAKLADSIQKIYNDRFNAIVPMLKIDDMFLSPHLPGQNSGKYSMYPHQQQAVARGLTQPLMLAHEVGTGKTISLISTAMEMRRLGIAKKPMIVVQNSTTTQFVAEAKDLYPNAKILTVSERDRTKEGRQEFYAKIKYNDWDLIVVPQSVFNMIPDSESRMRDFINEKIDEKMHALEAAREAGVDDKITRGMEKELARLYEDLETNNMSGKRSGKSKKKDGKKEAEQRSNAEAKATAMLDRRTDEVENFDDMEIDALLVDEAHNYKHLGFATMMTRGVKGVDPSYSKRAAALYLKCQSIYDRKGHRNVIFATGTPISNTAAEIWTFMKYLMPRVTMQENDIYYFDDFVHNFGKISEQLEFATNGKFKVNNRFAQYGNVPELMRLWLSVADCTLTREVGQVNDKVPEMEGGKAQDIFLPQSQSLIDIMAGVRDELDRYDKMSGKEKKENSQIPITMYGIAKRAAIDPRLVDANAADEPQSKTNRSVEEILRSLSDSKKYNGTVAIFCDNYQNKRSGFDIFNDIKEKLIKQGIPAGQTAIIRSRMKDKAKQKIFDAVREGEIRVIMGTTPTLGTGVNIQTRLHTLIHMDAPDRPMDYTQRNGRILRQGNMHKQWNIPVRVLRFGVEDSLDVTAYQRLKTKAGFIDIIMNGKSMLDNNLENRVLEEEEEGIFDNPVAKLSGSQYALLKSQAERDLRKWSARAQQHKIDQILITHKLKTNSATISDSERKIADNNKLIQRFEQTFRDGRVKEYNINGTVCHNSEEVKAALKKINKEISEHSESLKEKSSYYDDRRTLSYTIVFDGIPFNIDVLLTRKVTYGSGQRVVSIEKDVYYSSAILGNDKRVSPTKVLERLIDIIKDDILTGKKAREENDLLRNSIERLKKDNELMSEREGKPFAHQVEFEKAKALVEEYTKKMQEELAEKEAKYASITKHAVNLSEMDAEDDATDEEDSESEESPEAQYDELDYDARNLTDAQQVATDALVDALRDNTGIDVTIATEEEIASKAGREPQQREMLYTPQGKLYGWAEGNRIFLTPDGLNPNTPIHEYSHLWVKAVRRNNPELYKNLQDLFSRENLPEIWEKLDNDSNYAHLSEEGKLSEVISRFSGEHGAERMEAEAQKTAGDAKSLRERMKNLLREFWNWVGEHLFNIHNFGSREEAADRILYDLLNGTDLQLDANTPDAADVEFEAWEDRMFSVQSVPQIDKIEDFAHYVGELRKYEEDLQAEFGRIRREYQQSVIKNANIFRRLYNKIADYYRPIEHFTRFLRSHGGTLSLSDDPYYDKFLTRGRITTARSNFDKNEWKNLKDALSVLALQGGIKGIAAGIILRGRDANDSYIKMQCTPYDVISLYLQAKDMKEVTDMKGVDRGAVGFEEVTGINVETFINMVESSVDPDYIKDLWEKVKACTSFSLKYQHEHGYISKDTLNEYSKREYYVPQRGWRMRALSSYETGYVPDFNNDGSRPYNKALKKAKGRSSLADDPIAYIYSIAMSSIVETEKNISKQKLLKAVRDNINLAEATEGFGFRKVYYVNTGEKDDNGMPIFERTYDKPKKEWIENDKQIRKEIADVERDINDEATNLKLNPNLPTATFDALIQKRASLLASLKVAYRAGTNMGVKSMLSNEEKKQHVVRVIENGEEVEVWFTDERLANAMNDNFVYSQSSDVFSSIYNGLSRITRYMSAILTQYNPIWATWNYLRDFGTMFFSNIVTGDKEYLVPASKLAIGVIPSIARYLYRGDFNSKYGTYLQEFFNEGAETGFSFLSNIDEIGQAIKADVSLNGGGKVRKATEKLLGGLSFLTEMSELSIRLAQFIAMREAGKSATEAAIGAKEISVNFDRKSDLSRMLSPLFSFFNATIQGTNKFYRAIENNSVAKVRLTATGALFFLGGMMNALLAPDDPDEERAWSDYDRMTNILLGPVRIPLPHFLRTFWACGAQTALMMSGQKPIKEGMIDAVHFVLDDILPTQVNLTQLIQYENTTGKAVVSVEDYIQSMSPTTISPIVDIILNRDFMGRKIYKEPYVESQRGKIPQTQLAYRNTNPALQAFTDWLANVSGGSSVAKTNRDIPYLLDVNPGKMQHVISGYSPAIAETLVKFAGAVSDLVSGEGFDVSNIPFLSRAIKPYRAERLQKSLYWEIKGIVDRYEGDYKAYRKSPEKRDKATAKQMMSKDNRRLIRRARKILRTCDPDRRNATKEEIREMYEIKKEVIDAFID